MIVSGVLALAIAWQSYVRDHIQGYKPQIEQRLQQIIHLPIHIQSLEADWYFIFPVVRARGVCVDTPLKLCALGADELQLRMAWWNPWGLFGVDIVAPYATLQRDRDGHLSLSGIPLQSEKETDPEVLFERLLEQRHITMQEGTLSWSDLTGRTRPLKLKQLHAEFYNTWRRQELRFSAQTSPVMSSRLEGSFQFRPLGFHPRLSQMYGKGFLDFSHLDLSAWAPYVSELNNPIRRGIADLLFHFDIQSGRLRDLDTEIHLHKLEGEVDRESVQLYELGGHIAWSETGDADRGYHGVVTTQNLTLKSCESCKPYPINIETHLHYHHALSMERARTRIDALDLPTLSLLAQHIPLPTVWRWQLQKRFVEGTLDYLEADWDVLKPPFLPTRFRADLHAVGWKSLEKSIPSVHGLNLSLQGTPEQGGVTVHSPHLRILWPWLWPDFPVLSPVAAELSWRTHPFWMIEIKQATLHSADGMVTVKGSVSSPHRAYPGGWIQLDGKGQLHSAPRLMAYLPHTLPEGLLNWLSNGLKAGQGEMQWRVQGDPHHFPFLSGSPQEYLRFDIQAKQGVLQFAPNWSALTGIQGRVLLHKNRIDIQAKQAQWGGLTLYPATVALTGIGTGAAELQAQGVAQGTVAQALEVLHHTPLKSRIPAFIEEARLDGALSSHLSLHFPVAHPENIVFESESTSTAMSAQFPGLPFLSHGVGRLRLTDKKLIDLHLNGQLNGAPAEFTLEPKPMSDGFHLTAKGALTPELLSPWMAAEWRSHFQGQSDWSLEASFGGDRRFYRFHSSLKGLESHLPLPLAKAKEVEAPLELELERRGALGVWWLRLPQQGLQARWTASTPERSELRGHLMLGKGRPQPSLPETGWHVSGELDGHQIDVLTWWKNKSDVVKAALVSSNRESKPSWLSSLPSFPLRLDLLLVNMESVHPLLNNSVVRWRSSHEHIETRWTSRAVTGTLYWDAKENKDTVHIALDHLTLSNPSHSMTALESASAAPKSEPGNSGAVKETPSNITKEPEWMEHPILNGPSLAVRVNHLAYGNMNLGALTFQLESKKDHIVIPELELTTPDSHLKAEGSWNAEGIMHWAGVWDFENTGLFLKHLGIYDGLKNGSGQLKGALQWASFLPLAHPKTLAGEVELDFKNGQFIKVEPGLGKLLGLSSLQALPRRLALDFRDIFSEGFLFNQIKGKMGFEQARFQTSQDILLEGDSANLTIHGYTDLLKETQEFDVRVLPNLSTGVAAATAFLINPVVGGAAFVAQKVLKDPIDKAFSYHYRVTGTWSDPLIQSATAKAQLPPSKGGSD
jgi:uncharacterized protein (TIGR02099 family)